MNIFRVSNDPVEAARSLCDKHIVKMTTETAQLLCTALRAHGNEQVEYKTTHKNHPCTLWVGTSRRNFRWLVDHGQALGAEYTTRYDKIHKAELVIDACGYRIYDIPEGPETPAPKCVPEEFLHLDVVEAYRAYYRQKMMTMKSMVWKDGNMPEWMNT